MCSLRRWWRRNTGGLGRWDWVLISFLFADGLWLSLPGPSIFESIMGFGLIAFAVFMLAKLNHFGQERQVRIDYAARDAADRLLSEMLTEGQRAELERRGYLRVPSREYPGAYYKIPPAGMVRLCEDGIPIMSLCAQPKTALPQADHVLLHKWMIEGNEREYLRRANKWGRGPVGPCTEPMP